MLKITVVLLFLATLQVDAKFPKDNTLSGPNAPMDTIQVHVNLEKSVNTIGPRYVGVTIDSIQIAKNWSTLDFNSKKVQNMARALTPAYLRLGGTAADCVNFIPPTPQPPTDAWWDKCTNSSDGHKDINLTVTQWDAINHFVQTVGFDFIVDLNALHRYADDAWYIDNARQLLDYSEQRNYAIAGFELGNEYDLYQRTFNYSMDGSRLARDYITLQHLLSTYSLYADSMILGPETADVREEYFKGFLQSGGADVIRASTFHHYYFAANRSSVSSFTDVRIMDSFRDYLTKALTQSRSVNATLRSWLSETSTSYPAGNPHVSDRYAAGFLWLDKLGLCAEMGIETVIRQDFYGGTDFFALIDWYLNPNPDYFLTVLYKRLVRGAVFTVSTLSGDLGLRVYAACANHDRFVPGALVVYYLNTKNSTETLELIQFLPGSTFQLYILTPGDNDGLTSKFLALNGRKLELAGDELPDLSPVTTELPTVSIPPYSFGFVVVPNASIKFCMERQTQ